MQDNLSEEVLLKGVTWVDRYMNTHKHIDINLIPHLDTAYRAGCVDTGRKVDNLWQTLTAFRNTLMTLPAPHNDSLLQQLSATISLVDQCLIENKPLNIVP